MQRTALYALKGIGIVLFAWILLHIDIHSALQNFAQASPIFIGLTFVLFPIIYLIKSWRWHVLIRQKNIAVCFQESVHIYVASLFLGIVTPGRIGEALKIPWLKKHGLPLKTSIALTIADRLLDITTLFVLSIGALGILFDWKYAVAGLCVLLIATVLFCVRTHRIEHAWAQWKKPIMITILNWTIYFLQMVFLARAFNLVIPMPAFLASMTIAGVLSMLPIAPAGLGTRDAVLVLLFTQFSIVPAQTIAFSFSLFVLMLCASLIGAYFWLWSPYIRH